MAGLLRHPGAGARCVRLLCHIASWRPLFGVHAPGWAPSWPEAGELQGRAESESFEQGQGVISADAILARFDMVDSDHDGNVTLEEMRAGYGHRDSGLERYGEQLLQRMLAACTGHRGAPGTGGGVPGCTRLQMEASLAVRSASPRTAVSLRAQRVGSRSHHAELEDSRPHYVELEDPRASLPCGAALRAEPPRVKCTWQGPVCWAGKDDLAAWSLLHVCNAGGCICEPTHATKRIAKLGLMGAVALAGTASFSAEDEWHSNPSCGDGWEGVWKSQRVTGLNSMQTRSDWTMMKALAHEMMTLRMSGILDADSAYANFALWTNPRHQLLKDGPEEQVCMISWQGSYTNGDWKLNFMVREVGFTYGPNGQRIMLPRGLVLAYTQSRTLVKKTFNDRCCTDTFRAKRLIISGHSHGAALAEINAVDAITSWKCRGRKLTADHVSVVLVAPHAAFMNMKAINEVWSCPNKTSCLAGSAVTLLTRGDTVAKGRLEPITGLPLHPSAAVELPCRELPEDLKFANNASSHLKRHCHELENYVEGVEEVLVDQQGWGSTCSGYCGDPNRQLQCAQLHRMTLKSCTSGKPSLFGKTTPCNGTEAWQAKKEKCVCPLDRCDRLITTGCG